VVWHRYYVSGLGEIALGSGTITTSVNFSFLAEHDPVFVQLAAAAERSFISDPNTTLIKLRQLGEAIAQDLAARCNIRFDERTNASQSFNPKYFGKSLSRRINCWMARAESGINFGGEFGGGVVRKD
jgi:hypothetical protein